MAEKPTIIKTGAPYGIQNLMFGQENRQYRYGGDLFYALSILLGEARTKGTDISKGMHTSQCQVSHYHKGLNSGGRSITT